MAGWWVAAAVAGELQLSVDTVDFLLPENLERGLVPALTRIHAMHEDWLGSSLPPLLPLEVRVIRDPDTFGRVEETHGNERSIRVGYYRHSDKRVTVLYRSLDEARRVTLHEASHYLTHLGGRAAVPAWLREGVAEIGANTAVDARGRVWIEVDAGAWAMIGRRPRPKASSLVGLDADTWASLGLNPEYRYGWAICAFLLGSDDGRATLAAVMAATATGEDAGPAALAAIEQTYPGGVAAFDDGFARWTPSRIELHPRFAGAANDGWARCPDGSLIRLDAGGRCARWVAGPDGVMRYVEEDPLP